MRLCLCPYFELHPCFELWLEWIIGEWDEVCMCCCLFVFFGGKGCRQGNLKSCKLYQYNLSLWSYIHTYTTLAGTVHFFSLFVSFHSGWMCFTVWAEKWSISSGRVLVATNMIKALKECLSIIYFLNSRDFCYQFFMLVYHWQRDCHAKCGVWHFHICPIFSELFNLVVSVWNRIIVWFCR